MAEIDNPVQDATDELYSADPEGFLPLRGELAAAAKKSGDTAAAKRIGALRKPTRSAYAVNSLARSDPEGMAELVDLGEQLREAERTVDPRQIRELTKHRRRLVNELTRRAFEAIGEASPSSAVRDEVVSTLTAALADEGIAAQIAEGTLVKPARWDGFGSGGSPDLTLVPSAADPKIGGSRGNRASAEKDVAPQRPSSVGRSREDRAEARRKAEEQEAERKAQEKAAAQEAQRTRLAEARQAVDDAEEAHLLAADEEQRRVDRLRELEEQVADARKAVDEARVQLRRAEIRQRRAGDALARLGG